jgi:hypothetical protein
MQMKKTPASNQPMQTFRSMAPWSQPKMTVRGAADICKKVVANVRRTLNKYLNADDGKGPCLSEVKGTGSSSNHGAGYCSPSAKIYR